VRLWSIHPKYLDKAGLGACWREALLAKKVLEGNTKGYKNHSQLIRFKQHSDPLVMINRFLMEIWREAKWERGYNYDESKFKIDERNVILCIPVTRGQLAFEACHINSKIIKRSSQARVALSALDRIECHPIFDPCNGDVESWEKL